MKVITSEDNLIELDTGMKIKGKGDIDCCAVNFLDFEQLPVGTELPDMTIGQFVDAITLKEDGFIIKDIQETPKWIQARSHQNGYYSNMTELIIEDGNTIVSLGELSGAESDE